MDVNRILLRSTELAEILRLSVPAFYQRRHRGLILAPINEENEGHPRWLREEVEAWIRAGMPSQIRWDTLKRRKKSP